MIVAGVVALALISFAAVKLIGSGDAGGGQTGPVGLGGGVPQGNAPSDEPEERWSEKIKCPVAEEAYTGCDMAVGDSAVFVAGGDEENYTLEAFAKSDGSSMWDVDLSGNGSVVVLDNTVIAVASSYDDQDETTTSEVSALDPKTGDERWTKEFESAAVATFNVPGAVVVNDYSDSSETIVLDLKDGSELWSEGGNAVGKCGNSMILADEGDLIAVSAKTGDRAWSADTSKDSSIYSSTCIDGGVAVMDDGELVAFAMKDGEEMWSERLPDTFSYLGPELDNQIIVFGDNRIGGFSANDGSKTWDEKYESNDDAQTGDLFATDAGILLAQGGAEAVLRDAKTGDEKASARIGDAVSINMASNALLVGDGEELTAYDIASLDEKWNVDAKDVGAFFADDGVVFTLSNEELTAIG